MPSVEDHEGVSLATIARLVEKAIHRICRITTRENKDAIYKDWQSYHLDARDFVLLESFQEDGIQGTRYDIPAVEAHGVLNPWQLPAPMWAFRDVSTAPEEHLPGFIFKTVPGPALASVVTAEGVPVNGFQASIGMTRFYDRFKARVEVSEEIEGDHQTPKHRNILSFEQLDPLSALSLPGDGNEFIPPDFIRFRGRYRRIEFEGDREVKVPWATKNFLFSATLPSRRLQQRPPPAHDYVQHVASLRAPAANDAEPWIVPALLHDVKLVGVTVVGIPSHHAEPEEPAQECGQDPTLRSPLGELCVF
ncbi:hypothetical protein JCM3766R1_001713 [Sporobolomyces carnicolor]